MPRIDTDNIKVDFKKKQYRAWDNNLLEALKIPKNKPMEEITSQQSSQVKKLIKNTQEKVYPDSEFNQGLIEAQKGFKKGSIRVHSGSNKGAIEVQSEFSNGSIEVQTETNNKVHL